MTVNIRIHSSLIEIEFKVYRITDVVINCRTNGNFHTAIGGEGTVLVQAAVGTHVIPYPESKRKLISLYAIGFGERQFEG